MLMARILVVEDTNEVRRAITAILKSGHHDVSAVTGGRQALELLKRKSFDLVITDMLMPEVGGMEILTYLCTLPKRPLVVAMSGGGPGLPAEKALLGTDFMADAFLEKPIEKRDLLAVIDKLLSKAAA
jgi:CheY-like chemotaxis protein